MNYSDLKIFSKIPSLRTERLVLRKICRSDVLDVYEYASDPYVSKYLLWNPHRNISYTTEYLKVIERNYKKNNFFDWAITLADTNKMIGTCGFTSFDIPNNTAEIGYVLNRNYWGRGIAVEASNRIIEFGFNQLGLHRIEVNFMPSNSSSRRVAEKCGMHYEGLMKDRILVKGSYQDIEVYAITSSTY